MDTGTLSVGKIFGQDRRYVVPLYQRPYVWSESEQWEPLWDDVRSMAERLLAKKTTRPHFLGAIVLDQMRQPTGHVETRLVIDGQQRLTTIQIMLEAYADLARELGQEKLHKALLKLTRNDDPMSEDPDEVFKVWPTNVDREVYRRVMHEGSPAGIRRQLGLPENQKRAGSSVPDAYLFFHEVMKEFTGDDSSGRDERFDALYRALKDNLRLVVIDLESEDDAQLIFETLNARGTPLLPSDLVKNHLFHRADLEGASIDALHEKWWKYFDDQADFWRDEVGKGRGKRARIDVFLQDYLTLHQRDDVKIAHLYGAYREHIAKRTEDRAADHMERLHRYARVYESFDRMPDGSPEAVFFARLRSVEMTTAHPFLLELFHRHGANQEGVRQVLRDIESFVVRRMVCRYTTKQYNRMFIDALKKLECESETVAAQFRSFLLDAHGDSQRWPTDAEFRRAWLDDPLGSALPRARITLVLGAIEEQSRSSKSEASRIDQKLTVEHLLPQSWQRHWPLEAGHDPNASIDRDRILQTIGNLTLLTQPLNADLSNGPWQKKRETILDHSVLRLNSKLRESEVWDETAIRRRSGELFEQALAIWPKPTVA